MDINYNEIEKDLYYSNGTVDVSVVEDNYISVEFFPNNQTKESFERAEFNNVYSIDEILNNTNKNICHPKDMKLDEVLEVYQEVFNRVKNNIKG